MPTTSQIYASPTESDFSDADGPDSVKNWDEDKVCEYLRSVKCGEYEKLFRKNHINGENLLEMDKEVLKEMGIEKVGDRVRLFLGIKKLRTKAYANQKKRNRVGPNSRNADIAGCITDCGPFRTRLVALIFTSLAPLVAHRALLIPPGPCLLQPRTSDTRDRLTCPGLTWLMPPLDPTLLYPAVMPEVRGSKGIPKVLATTAVGDPARRDMRARPQICRQTVW